MNSRININDPTAWSDLNWDDPTVPDALKRTDQAVNVARANRIRAQDPVQHGGGTRQHGARVPGREPRGSHRVRLGGARRR